MKVLPKVVESKTKIRFQDCDPFNHLNNASYINYFMNHREDQLLEHYNLDIYKMAQSIGKSWVSSSNQIAYLKPAYLMETVLIESQLIKHSKTELQVEMRMYNEDKSQLKAVIWCSFVHFNFIKQSREIHNEDFVDLFNNISSPVEANTFEDRIFQIKKGKTLV